MKIGIKSKIHEVLYFYFKKMAEKLHWSKRNKMSGTVGIFFIRYKRPRSSPTRPKKSRGLINQTPTV